MNNPKQLFDAGKMADWLEKKPQNGWYRYWTSYDCLLAQYFRENGFENVHVGPSTIYPWGRLGPDLAIPSEINKVAYGGPFRLFRTFGGALKRARRLLNKETQEYALQEAGAR